MPGPDDFYDFPGPSFLQQGDVLSNVPLVSLPPSRELILLREHGTLARLQELAAGPVDLVRETKVNAFLDENREFIAALAQRLTGVLVTQTCNLVREDSWLIAPVFSIEATKIVEGNLFAGKYENFFGLRPHPQGLYGMSYADLNGLRSIRRDSVGLSDRVAALLPIQQTKLTEQIARALARDWGHAAGEKVPRDGKYRCLRCNRWYDVENPPCDLKAGDQFPECDKCHRIGKSAQWNMLQKYRKY